MKAYLEDCYLPSRRIMLDWHAQEIARIESNPSSEWHIGYHKGHMDAIKSDIEDVLKIIEMTSQ